MLDSSDSSLVWSNSWLGGMAVWLGKSFIVPMNSNQMYMYYVPQERKKSDFSQVHEAAAKLSGSPSAPYVLSAELG